ncbi:hypothetical protein [Alicyclobacillus sp. SO9]|uniref:hypothetical protein n=1 Tax=Alicyclobacillus sp. SO9 TaxID=2665646 RepID=UPI0018E7B47D|nr:hypothetical protein [Alicyclobacillus sp. SO9]QQE80990.1 hypothetical protein GI364_11780 [Alicyclobacillus sp. SO9]
MKFTTFSKRTITKIWCLLAMFPPITYVGLTATPPMPYSPVLDYALVHSSEYNRELSQTASWLEVSHTAIRQDMKALDQPDTSWTVPNPPLCRAD